MQEFKAVSAGAAIIAEGPLWQEKTNTLCWIDINGKRIHSRSLEDGKESAYVIPEQPGCIFFDESDRINVCSESGIYLLGEDGELSLRFAIKPSGRRFNDGKVGPDGNLWVGTISKELKGHLYRITPAGECSVLMENVGNSNGLDWDTKRQRFYLNDTYKRLTYVFDYDEQYNLSEPRILKDWNKEGENPDGMAIDSEGNLHIAMFGSSRILKLDGMTGEVLSERLFPLPNVSSVLFFGENLDRMAVTTAAYRVDLLANPYAGYVLVVDGTEKGVPIYKLKNV